MRFYILLSAFLFSTGIGSSQSGWRMIGHDASRTNRSPATGPSALPSFQPLIQNISGTLRLIGPDGSLVFFDGTPNGGTLSSYSSTGTPKWVQGIALNDVAMMPNGTVVVSSITTHSVTALDKDTGRPVWPKPFTNGINGNETAGLAIDSSGVVYVVTGASFVGVPETLTAINPDGTLKWQNSQPGRGGVGPLLTNDESIVYIPFQPGVEALSAATGTEIGGAVFNVQLAAPWGSVYSTPRGSFSLFGLWECTLTRCSQITSTDVEGVATIVPPNTLIAVTNISGGISRLQGIDRRTGNALWTATEGLDYMIADANGTIYAVDLQTNDLVALNGLTGSQLWRQHFDYPTFALSPPLLGDDGSLYVTAGTTLYKSTLPRNSCTGVNIDQSQSNGQIAVSLAAGACDALLTIQNKKNYWTNFQISPTGSATATPVGGNANPYARAGLLPPSGLVGSSTAVMYMVHFSKPRETITIYVDPTGQTGNGYARLMNFVQVILNATPFGSTVQMRIDFQEEVVQAFAQMPHLNNASAALFANPPSLLTFIKELAHFLTSGSELSELASLLGKVGSTIGTTGLKTFLGTPWRVVNTVISAFGNIIDFTFRYPTGSVLLTAQ